MSEPVQNTTEATEDLAVTIERAAGPDRDLDFAIYRAENGCTRGQRTTQWCGEASKLRRAWLAVIQLENGCPPSGGGCLSEQCGCIAEMQALSEYAEASRD